MADRGEAIPRVVGAGLRRLRLVAEFVVLFVALPLAVLVLRLPQHLYLPGLVLGGVLCWVALRRDPTFDRSRLWEGNVALRHVARVLGIYAVGVVVIGAGVAAFAPEMWMGLVRRDPAVWRVVMLLYPVVSVLPQGIIWRVFLFHRYRELFGEGWLMVLVSALAFAWVHVIFQNWLAVGLTLLGGVLFAWTYRQTRSNAVASFEHTLYGWLMFTIGLGSFFYGGTPRG